MTHKCILIFTVFLFLFQCQAKKNKLPFFNSAELLPEWIDDVNLKVDSMHTISSFEFRNQNNELVNNEAFDNHIYVTDFFFTTCPSICPKMTDSMLELQKEFEDDPEILLLSHTVTPWMDTVKQLKKYAVEKGVQDSKWHLVTGPEEEIYKLARRSYFVDGKIGLQIADDEFLHTENFILIDGKRRVRGLYNGTIKSDIQRLVEDIYILKQE